jgi:hypothetical protein
MSSTLKALSWCLGAENCLLSPLIQTKMKQTRKLIGLFNRKKDEDFK